MFTLITGFFVIFAFAFIAVPVIAFVASLIIGGRASTQARPRDDYANPAPPIETILPGTIPPGTITSANPLSNPPVPEPMQTMAPPSTHHHAASGHEHHHVSHAAPPAISQPVYPVAPPPSIDIPPPHHTHGL